MMDNQPARRQEVEAHFKMFPDVPREVIVKEDVLRNGVDFTDAALRAGEGRHTKTYHLFTADQATPGSEYQIKVMKIPSAIQIWGGLYNLVPYTTIRVRLTPESPYVVHVIDEAITLCEREGGTLTPIALIKEYPPLPKYYSKTFPDGTPYKDVVQSLSGNLSEPRIVAMLTCQHWGPRQECKFCDINVNVRLRKQRGSLQMGKLYQDPHLAGEAMKEVVLGEDWDKERFPKSKPDYYLLTGGTIIRKFKGLGEEDFYLQYVNAVNESLGNIWPMDCDLQTHPKPKDVCQRWYEAGVKCHEPNYEVWDKRLFRIICPGKDRVVGRDNWVRRTIEEVEVFGVGNVIPGFVAGIEMAQPWGFKTIKEAIASNKEGFEYLMSNGVIPRPLSWCVEAGSAVGGHPQLPLEYYVRLDIAWYETWKKYGLPQDFGGRGLRAFGTGINSYPNNASRDMVPPNLNTHEDGLTGSER